MKRINSPMAVLLALFAVVFPIRPADALMKIECRFDWDTNESMNVKGTRNGYKKTRKVRTSEYNRLVHMGTIPARISEDRGAVCTLNHPENTRIDLSLPKKTFRLRKARRLPNCVDINAVVTCTGEIGPRQDSGQSRDGISTGQAGGTASDQHAVLPGGSRYQLAPGTTSGSTGNAANTHPPTLRTDKPTGMKSSQPAPVTPNKSRPAYPAPTPLSSGRMGSTTFTQGSPRIPPLSNKQPGTRSPAPYKPSPHAVTPKVNALLNKLRGTQTVDQAQKLIKAAGLSVADTKSLEYELTRPQYNQLIKRLKRDAGQTRQAMQLRPPVNNTTIASVRAAVEKEKRQTLTTLNTESQRQVDAIRNAVLPATVSSSRSDVVASLPRTRIPTRENLYEGTSARISGVQNELVRVNETLEIYGSGFGDIKGSVYLIVGEHTPSAENIFYTRPIEWSDEEITINIPFVIDEFIRRSNTPDRQLKSLVWIKPAYSPVGPTKEIQIKSRSTKPVLQSAPSSITPGQQILITGEDLTNDLAFAPRVRMIGWNVTTLGERRRMAARLPILEYGFTYILARVPENLSGFIKSPVEIEVFNGDDTSTWIDTEFIPALDVEELWSDTMTSTCHSPLELLIEEAFDQELDSHSAFCLFGTEDTQTPVFISGHRNGIPMIRDRLRNGWETSGSRLSVEERGASGDCYYSAPPEDGTTGLTHVRVVSWANAYSRVDCRAVLVIRGPKGISPYRDRLVSVPD